MQERSSSRWLESMDDKIPHKVLQTPNDIKDQIPELAEQHEYLIVDSPGGLSEPTRAILFRADIAVVKCKPTGLDLQSAFDALKLVRQAQSVRKGSPKAAMFLSMAVKGTKLKDEAISVLDKTQDVAPLLKSVIHLPQAIALCP